jgi:hypothetical protein
MDWNVKETFRRFVESPKLTILQTSSVFDFWGNFLCSYNYSNCILPRTYTTVGTEHTLQQRF